MIFFYIRDFSIAKRFFSIAKDFFNSETLFSIVKSFFFNAGKLFHFTRHVKLHVTILTNPKSFVNTEDFFQ